MVYEPPDKWMYSFHDWLSSTTQLQIQAYKQDPAFLIGSARKDFIRWNVLAATDELHEFLAETDWKPWTTSKEDRERAIDEIVDALHFIANLLAVFTVSGSELTSHYRAKQIENARRQEDGYIGRSGQEKKAET